MAVLSCKLCGNTAHPVEGVKVDDRDYYHCETCHLIQVSLSGLPGKNEEKQKYDTHQNGPQYPGYMSFLSKVVNPMLPLLEKGMYGLDYGCGPGPAISYMLDLEGMECDDYDPIYFPVHLQGTYDFIFATECWEHFHDPLKEINKLNRLLKDNGHIGVMTETYDTLERFKSWYYLRDYTHVVFYHKKTMQWIANQTKWKLAYTDDKRVFILKKERMS